MPRRLSEAMATQSLPDMAIIAAPLYSRMDILDYYCGVLLLIVVCACRVDEVIVLCGCDIVAADLVIIVLCRNESK